MYIFLIIVHVVMCLVLIFVVLLQAGRGGGFSEMLGGGQPQSLFGTQTNAFMTRATEICAVVFILTSLTLGIMSTQRGKSLLERKRVAQSVKTSIPRIPQAAGQGVAAQLPAAPAPIAVPKAEPPTAPQPADANAKDAAKPNAA